MFFSSKAAALSVGALRQDVISAHLIQGRDTATITDVSHGSYHTETCLFFCRRGSDPSYTTGICLIDAQDPRKTWPKDLMVIAVAGPILLAWTKILTYFYPSGYEDFHIHGSGQQQTGPGIHPTAWVDATATLGIGTTVGPFAYIGPEVRTGKQCHIRSQATVICTQMGNDTYVGPGARIGQRGFGFIPGRDQVPPMLMPHLGHVVLGHNVCLGANVTIDRGVLYATHLDDGVCLDNMVHIAHNVRVGRNSLMAAQCGISGTTVIEDHVHLGGQVGVAGHITLKQGTQVAAQSGIMRSTKIKDKLGGSPAQPFKQWLRSIALAQFKRRPKP